MKNLSILGSTGSIGTQSLDVCRMHAYSVKCLTANKDVKKMETQIREFNPELVCMMNEDAAEDLKTRVADLPVKVTCGMQGLIECATYSGADTVLNSVVGMIGLLPTIEAIKAKKTIALANKETLVAGGSLVIRLAKENGVSILPVDSEHSAIFQALQGCPSKDAVKKIILTASGGPFFGKTLSELEDVTPADALKHPNWNMGAKITIDSATMMNKGLEFIEAKWLFDMPNDAIEIVVHRESVVHSAIVYKDNSVIAQLGVPDMRIPIQYALTYPAREESPVQELSLADYGKLTFFEPDYKTFKCIDVCKKAIALGGLHPAAANGANEESVKLFLNGKIKFTDIAYLNEEAMLNAPDKTDFTLSDVLEADRIAREFVIHNYQ
ncbi:MAG TPA: 1-deoxy-D-xylulose-5-phosphate reductoisomerase [Candidatus Eubacterium faecale]|uniref:1-deoxy-D-xylulose 5-phosphate reductoisomerase n=1 Tax=Candidatus Eubacterium faecale TaxID=2838568 RepID=A0A9D2MHJ4_9FIRM|nr:1-deoxy-D-xylulose-5-phosphate reductoisomerase [Candidatus Eubacterium faecale]